MSDESAEKYPEDVEVLFSVKGPGYIYRHIRDGSLRWESETVIAEDHTYFHSPAVVEWWRKRQES